MKGKSKVVQVALYGMDAKAQKLIEMYLKGPCRGVAIVVDEADAMIDIIDADSTRARDILDERILKNPDRPIIVMALEKVSVEGTVFVSKPVKANELIAAFKEILSPKKKKIVRKPKSKPESVKQTQSVKVVEKKQTDTTEPVNTRVIDKVEKSKVTKHRTAIDLSDEVFSSYIGYVDGVDFSDRKQVLRASFSSKGYFLSYLQSALRIAREKKSVLQLNSSWKPLIIFPDSHDIWLDVDDKQLRAFSGITMNKWDGKGMSLSVIDPEKAGCQDKMECFHDMDAFIWKVALWTSKGRYPDIIDINKPIFLKNWPNFTRLLITPHALQISAMLTNKPTLLMDVVDGLEIKAEYAFVFISAAYALGLVGQIQESSKETTVSSVKKKKPKNKSLLGRLLGKLRR